MHLLNELDVFYKTVFVFGIDPYIELNVGGPSFDTFNVRKKNK